MWCATFGALCGQQDYVVLSPKDPVSIGFFALATPHNISHGSVLKSSSVVPSSRIPAGHSATVALQRAESLVLLFWLFFV
jgi:hypothetical protein